jgi:SAM-dependent methyltransferase
MLRLKQEVARIYTKVAQLPLRPILRYEWSRRDQRRLNERPMEYAFALHCLAGICPTKVLDVGAGITAWPQLLANCGFEVTAIDEGTSYWGSHPSNRHHYVLHDDITNPQLREEFDAITCLSVLEHVEAHEAAMGEMRRLVKKGGHVIISTPYNEQQFVENVYALDGVSYGFDAPYICRVYSRSELQKWLERGFELVRQDYYDVFTGELWAFGERLRPPLKTSAAEPHHLTCILLRAS